MGAGGLLGLVRGKGGAIDGAQHTTEARERAQRPTVTFACCRDDVQI
jgi:hypothetical protein